ncbi:MAG TPA: DUF4130 domain-containing protein, partial [Chthoniobacteraceae bacterium]|nr:DUF4130 domain-containing protein [Chthoniobacteraceae bacterium]
MFEPSFESWKAAAREQLAAGVPPHEIIWSESTDPQPSFAFALSNTDVSASRFTIPKKFLHLAEYVARYSHRDKWALLYRTLWRLTHGERDLLDNPADSDVIALTHFEKEVRKDAYRMTAFLRFRELSTENGPWFIAWYEPEHDTV